MVYLNMLLIAQMVLSDRMNFKDTKCEWEVNNKKFWEELMMLAFCQMLSDPSIALHNFY
jgi:hypothetical protein